MTLVERINQYILKELEKHSSEIGIYIAISLICTFLWISQIIDAIKSDFKDPNNKIIWIIVLILAPPIGTVLYILLSDYQKTIKRDILEKPFIPEEKGRDWTFK